jgi:hypothetical protein
LPNIRKKSTIVLNLNITWPVRRNNLVRYLLWALFFCAEHLNCCIAATFVLVQNVFTCVGDIGGETVRIPYVPYICTQQLHVLNYKKYNCPGYYCREGLWNVNKGYCFFVIFKLFFKWYDVRNYLVVRNKTIFGYLIFDLFSTITSSTLKWS